MAVTALWAGWPDRAAKDAGKQKLYRGLAQVDYEAMSFARRMRSVPLSRIKVTDQFWTRWQDVLVEKTLPAEFEQIVETKRLALFRRAAGLEKGGHEGLFFNDSDVYKWLEACAYGLASRKNQKLLESVGEAIEAIVAAQEPDGYINTFFQLKHPTMKWRNLSSMHEMYCGGHLIEAGVALQECLNDRRLLDVSIRFADHVMSLFGPGKRRGYCGHEEIELALIRLAHATGEDKYREFARWLVEQRGQRPSLFEEELADPEAMALSPFAPGLFKKGDTYDGSYAQDHAPIREHTEVVGHAVRAMYLYIAAADLAGDQNDPALESALERAWYNLTRKRMYVTGGIGPSSHNEGFTADYDLPNLTAYAETCAACGLAFWGHKMLEMTGDSSYADIIERALYNGALSGISLSGDHFFYDNPLESRGTHHRVPWFECACCPPNIARLIGAVGHYAAGVSDKAFFLHIPVGLEADVELAGKQARIVVESDYPWSGAFKVKFESKDPIEFALYVRIPDWADEVSTDLDGSDDEAEYESGYAVWNRVWKPGEALTVDFGMEPRWVEANPQVRDNLGRVALTNGPLIYAAEQHDLEYAPQLFTADTTAQIELQRESILEGINTLQALGYAEIESFPEELYASEGNVDLREATAKFIPYYAWCNRGPTNMQVWVRRA